MGYNVMNQWQAIRSDLRTLGINYNGRGNGRWQRRLQQRQTELVAF
jgi:hypothetical protein